MKFLKFLLTTVVIVGCIGYGIYYFGTNIASEHVMDAVSAELESSGQLEEIKQFINNDPELKQFVEEGANVDVSKLPFTTKEQATRVLIKKIGIGELQNIQAKVQQGMSNNEMQMLLKEIEGKLTDEEIVALKVIAFKELNK